MDFESILDAATDLLRRRGRMTLRALKRQFDLDDDYLEDLKAELIEGQQIARLEGTVLVYDGPDAVSSWRRVDSVDEAGPARAERRQLTVMFCDLVDSAALSSRLDPEDFTELLHAYQATCDTAVKRYDGFVAQYLGDGILIYFGYPVAHEDEAQRAVRAGLAVLAGLDELNDRLEVEKGLRIAARIGVHTGVVVIDEVGAGSQRETLALGEAPNVAARLQALGEPNTMLISGATRDLVADRFELRDRGVHQLKGLGEPTPVHQVVGFRRAGDRTARWSPGMSFVGRESELATLMDIWSACRDGESRVALVSGEAGMGKSRLVDAVRTRVADDGGVAWVFQCSPYFTHTALHPIVDHLHMLLGLDEARAAKDKLDRLVDMVERLALGSTFAIDHAVPLFASLLSVSLLGRFDEPPLADRRARIHDLLLAWLTARDQPMLVVWEDLHWADPSTLELLTRIVTASESRRVMTLMTARPVFESPWADDALLALSLPRLGRADVMRIVADVAHDKALPADMLDELLAKTDGIPLFAEELTKTLLDTHLIEEGDRFVASGVGTPMSIPATLQASLMARLDHLGEAKRVAQVGSTIGREFTAQLIAEVAEMDAEGLQHALDRLVSSGLVLFDGARDYRFKHALVQDTAYDSMVRTSRAHIHGRVATALEKRFPSMVETRPELLAHHLSEAGHTSRAIEYWQRAGRRASERSANAEAVAHFGHGLRLLEGLPADRARDVRELELQVPCAGALRATKGFAAPDTGDAFMRARQLCHALGETEQLIPTLNGLYSFYLVRNQHDRAGDAARELLAVAEKRKNETYQMIGHRAVGAVLFHTREPNRARHHLQRALDLYDIDKHGEHAFLYGTDHAETASCFMALSLWVLGYGEQAHAQQRHAVAHAERLKHSHSIAQALTYQCFLYVLGRDFASLPAVGSRLVHLSTEEHSFPLMAASGRFWLAMADAAATPNASAVAHMRSCAEAWWATGARTYRPYQCTLIAEASRDVDPDAGFELLADVEAEMATSNERWAEAELHRVRGELHLASGDRDKAEASFVEALAVADGQDAKMWGLRAAVSLAELWSTNGRSSDAMALVAPRRSWFSECLDSHDVRRADRLLSRLASD